MREDRVRPYEVTFGILTALRVEANAISSLIDNVGYFRAPNDPIEYRIGTLPSSDPERPHVVAVGLVPEWGGWSIATCCTDMLRTFPHIDTVISTGIAGGVPRPDQPDRYVRLGDIVVAEKIVDYGRVRRASTSRPMISPRLLRAARELQLSESLGHRPWQPWLEQALGYARQARPSDDFPRVYYGVLGSSAERTNAEMDADAIAEQFPDMVAVEMEGAGIAAGTAAHDLTWFVVRGISDYVGSTEKGDRWHTYASCAAAAYVRALLAATRPLAATAPLPDFFERRAWRPWTSIELSADLRPIISAIQSFEPEVDPVSIAEALWWAAHLRTAATAAEAIAGTGLQVAGSAGSRPEAGSLRTPAQPSPEPSRIGQPLYDMVPGPPGGGAARKLGVASSRALPRALELARALRPLRTRWPAGRNQQLDPDATTRAYAETGWLVPMFRPAPERWFDAALVVDSSPGMAAWDDVAREFQRVLTQLGAFRTIQTLRLHLGDQVELRDTAGRPAAPRRLRAADARRLIFVFSDCAGEQWQQPAIWQALRAWSESTPTALVNPLSAKLWDHIGLDLPATRVQAPVPGSPNQAWRFRVPPTAGLGLDVVDRLLPIPVLGLTPRSLRRFANTLMRGDLAGCEAVLTTPHGRPRNAAPTINDEWDEEPQALALVTAFRRLASPAASRLAVLAATYERLTLPVLRLIADRVVPEAAINDIGEVVAGGLFTVDAGPDQPFLSFRAGVREHLQQHLHVDDVWHIYQMLSRHVADWPATSDRFQAATPQEGGPVELASDAVPFALASEEALRLLGFPTAGPVGHHGRSAANEETPAPPEATERAPSPQRTETVDDPVDADLLRRTAQTPPDIGSDIWSVAVTTADGRTVLALGADDGALRLWSPATSSLQTLPVGNGPVHVAASPTTKWLVAGAGSDVVVLDPVTTRTLSNITPPIRSRISSLCLVAAESGDLAVVGTESGEIHRLEPGGDHGLLGTVSVVDGPVYALCCLVVDARAVLVAAGARGQLTVLDAETLEIVRTLRGHTGQINQLAVAPSLPGHVASASDDGTMRLWDITGGAAVRTYNAAEWVNAVIEVPQASEPAWLVWGDRSGAVWWSSGRNEPVVDRRGKGAVTALASFISAGRPVLAALRRGGRVELWELPAVPAPSGGDNPPEDELFGETLPEQPEPSLSALLRHGVQEACDSLANTEVADTDFDGFAAWAEGGASIDEVEPDLDTIDWWRVDTYDGGTEIGVVEVDAEVRFDGYMHKSDVNYRDVTILEFDWNESYSWVSFAADQPWRLRFDYLLNPGERPELQFEGVVTPEINPHSLQDDPSPSVRPTGKTLRQALAANPLDPDGEDAANSSNESTDIRDAEAQQKPTNSVQRLVVKIARQYPEWGARHIYVHLRNSRHDISFAAIRYVLESMAKAADADSVGVTSPAPGEADETEG